VIAGATPLVGLPVLFRRLAVFAVLSRYVTEGEIEDVKRVLPEGIRELATAPGSS